MLAKIKNGRINKGLKLREVAEALKVDAFLVSKFESGARKPTRERIIKLANLLKLDAHGLLLDWLSNQIVEDIG